MEANPKTGMNLLAGCCACSLSLIMIHASLSRAEDFANICEPAAAGGNLSGFCLTFSAENDIISTIGIVVNGGELASAAPGRVIENSNAPHADPFLRGAETMRSTANFISCAFCGTASVLSSSVIGETGVTGPFARNEKVPVDGRSRSHFQKHGNSIVEKHNDRSCNLRSVSVITGAAKSLLHIAGPNSGGEKE